MGLLFRLLLAMDHRKACPGLARGGCFEWEVELRGILVNPDGRAGGDRDDGSRQ